MGKKEKLDKKDKEMRRENQGGRRKRKKEGGHMRGSAGQFKVPLDFGSGGD